MKRYIIGLTLASALTMGLTSCSDFLEEPIRGQQDMENYFTTEEECEKQITGCFGHPQRQIRATCVYQVP